MPYPPITPLPAVPNRSAEPEIFSDAVDAFLTALPTLQEQIDAAGTYIQGVGAQVDADKTTTGGHVTAAAGSASAAASSQALAAASADFKGAWASLTGALNKPASVSHNGSFWALNVNLANVTTQEPSLTNANWQFISGTRWQAVMTTSGALPKNAMCQILATSVAVDRQLEAGMSVGDFTVAANSVQSTQLVRVTNNGYTIRSKLETLTSSDNIVLLAGDSVSLRCTAANTLEVYNG